VALVPGARLGSYEILSLLGSGGMGEVYRARDMKLGRDVALKILPDSFTDDPERVARFRREAQILAVLNHPHVGAIYGLDEANGTQFLVLELIDGDSLAARIARGPIAVDEALAIGKQIAEALEAAHEKGIIHRDLKPANIVLTTDDQVKVLDFGLAKAADSVVATDPSNSPTITSAAMTTGTGMILGTATYMSPEQARGRAADKRSDIWAFGCVLYEMLTGRRAFQGGDVSDTLASVLRGEPDWGALPVNTPPSIRAILEGCLKKDRKQRLGDISAALFLMDTAGVPARTAGAAAPVPPFRLSALGLVAVALAAGALSAALTWWLKPSPSRTVARFRFPLPEGQQFTNAGRQLVAISPDGTLIVYVANQRLYLRSISDADAKPIAGTEITREVLTHPVFSPDGRSIAYYSDGVLKKISVGGGSPVTICQATNPNGLSWTQDGIVVGQDRGIHRVSADGGKLGMVIPARDGEVLYGPQVLPGGQELLFTVASETGTDRWDKAQIVVQSIPSGRRKTLIEGGSDARYLPTGHIVYALGGTLFGVPFDLKRLEIAGGPVPVLEGIRRAFSEQTGTAHFSVSNTGSLVYVPGPASTSSQHRTLVWIDRAGKAEPLNLPQSAFEFPRLSPNGKMLAFGTDDGKDAIVWIYDVSGTSPMRRLTFARRNRFPIWSADSQRVAFQSDREGDHGIFWQRADGTGAAERLTTSDRDTSHVPQSWSTRGDQFLFAAVKGPDSALWRFSLSDRKAAPVDQVHSGSGFPLTATFAPDAKWVAYTSTETDSRTGVFVQSMSPLGPPYEIAKPPAASHPLWSPSGTEFFYVVAGSQFYSVSITTQPNIKAGNPVTLPNGMFGASRRSERNFDVTPDGKRFIGIVPAGQTLSTAPQIEVVLNWMEELKTRLPPKS
jgi:serine/threonine-protein kinase